MKKIILAALITVSALAGGFGSNSKEKAQYLPNPEGGTNQYIICTASETGSYYRAGKKLRNLLGADRKNNTYFAYPATTDGTKQNINLMADGTCNVAIVQGDYVAYLRGKDKSFFDGKSVISLERTENVQLIMRKGADEDDLQSKGSKILTGLTNSGGSASWDLIRSLEPSYKAATVINGDIDISALSDLADGRIDAIIRTSHLDPKNDTLAHDVSSNKKIEFVDLDDKDLNDGIDFGAGEQPIYKFVDTVVDIGWINTEAETLETKVIIIVDKSAMSKKQKNRILRAISQNTSNLF